MRAIGRIALSLAALVVTAGAQAQADSSFGPVPSNVPVNEAISPAVIVSVDPPLGGSLDGVSVRVGLCGGPSATLLGHTTGYTDASGSVVFGDLRVDTPGMFQLCASGAGSLPDGAWGFLSSPRCSMCS